MRTPIPDMKLLAPLALLFALWQPAGAGATDLPWSEVRFEAKSMWATALTRINLKDAADPDFGPVWQLDLEGSVASNTEREAVLMSPEGNLLRRDRFTAGKDQRLKQYAYIGDTVTRVRRVPGASPEQAPVRWPVSSEKSLPRPTGQDCPVLTAIPTLLALASAVPEAPDRTLTTCVHSDTNFYRVTMAVSGQEKLAVNYQLAGQPGKVKGKPTALVIRLAVERVGEVDGKNDFSLLGLSGQVEILLDPDSGLPLQVRGRAPRVGNTRINLVAATLESPPVDTPH